MHEITCCSVGSHPAYSASSSLRGALLVQLSRSSPSSCSGLVTNATTLSVLLRETGKTRKCLFGASQETAYDAKGQVSEISDSGRRPRYAIRPL
jgi:hypothetical protein